MLSNFQMGFFFGLAAYLVALVALAVRSHIAKPQPNSKEADGRIPNTDYPTWIAEMPLRVPPDPPLKPRILPKMQDVRLAETTIKAWWRNKTKGQRNRFLIMVILMGLLLWATLSPRNFCEGSDYYRGGERDGELREDCFHKADFIGEGRPDGGGGG